MHYLWGKIIESSQYYKKKFIINACHKYVGEKISEILANLMSRSIKKKSIKKITEERV